jgi:hypothetical protein
MFAKQLMQLHALSGEQAEAIVNMENPKEKSACPLVHF